MAADSDIAVLYRAVLDQLESLRQEIQTVREAVIRMETHGYGVQIEELRRESRETRDKVLVIETKGRMASGVVAAAVSVAIMVAGGIILYALNIPVHVG
jgi:hypothetical protein